MQFEITLRKSAEIFVGIAFVIPLLLTGCGGGSGGNGSATVALNSIVITSASVTSVVSQTTQFTASGIYSNGTTADITSSVTWLSSNSTAATVNNTSGMATGVGTGSTNISASSSGVSSNSVTLSVTSPKPLSVFAVSGSGQVAVSWSPVSGATSYNIYRGTAAGISTASAKVNGATSPYTQTGLTTGLTYYYRVSALGMWGESLSDEVFSFVYTGGIPSGSFTMDTTISSGVTGHTATLLPNGDVLYIGGMRYTTGSNIVYSHGVMRFNSSTGVATPSQIGLIVAREAHSATLLPNGKVLVAGGVTAGSFNTPDLLNRAEIYDPATGISSVTGSMSRIRTGHTAILLPNGKVLIIGGDDGGAGLAFGEIYDPATGLFSVTSNMTQVRSSCTATLMPNGKVLIAGGYAWPTPLASAEIYDPTTDTFSTTGSMTTSRFYHSATLLPSGNVLIVGGDKTSSYDPLVSAEIYDPKTGAFSATGSMAVSRAGHTATLLHNGTVLIVGSGEYVNTRDPLVTEIYNPANGIFTITAGANDTNLYHLFWLTGHTTTLLPHGEVIIFGGNINYLNSSGVFPNVYRFNI